MEYLVTGSVDDAVKVWEQKDKSLQLKYKLSGHSLGVVSVAVNSDGSSKEFITLFLLYHTLIDISKRIHLC